MKGAPGAGPGLALRPLLIFHTFLLSAIFFPHLSVGLQNVFFPPAYPESEECCVEAALISSLRGRLSPPVRLDASQADAGPILLIKDSAGEGLCARH